MFTFQLGKVDFLLHESFALVNVLVLRRKLALDDESISLAVLALQVLNAPQTLELAIDHDAKSRA